MPLQCAIYRQVTLFLESYLAVSVFLIEDRGFSICEPNDYNLPEASTVLALSVFVQPGQDVNGYQRDICHLN